MKKNTILIGIGAASILVAYLLFKKKPLAKGDVKPSDKVQNPKTDGVAIGATPQEVIFTEPISRAYQDGFELTPNGFYPEVAPIYTPKEFVYPEVSPFLYQQSIEYAQTGLGDRLMINQLM
jgi:hypothetical protein